MRLIHDILLGLQLATAVSAATTPCKQHDCPCPPHPTCAQQVEDSKWVVEHFSYNASYIFTTPAHQNSHGYVSFDVFNTAAPWYTATCSASSSQLTDFFYGTQWYICALPPAAAQVGARLQFKFNRPTGELGLNATIICPGEGQGTGNEHYVEATTQLTLACIDMAWTNPNYTLASGEFYSDREVKCVPDSCVV